MSIVLTPAPNVILTPVVPPKIYSPVCAALLVDEIDEAKYPPVVVPEPPVVKPAKVKAKVHKRPARIVPKEDSDDEIVPELVEYAGEPVRVEIEEEEDLAFDDEIPEVTIGDIRMHLGIVDLDAGAVNLAKVRRNFAAFSQPMKDLFNNSVVPAIGLLLLNPGMECIPEEDRKDVALYSVLTGWVTAIDESPEMLSAVHELAPKGVAGIIGL